jgi:ketosteroid isomerase-like protein
MTDEASIQQTLNRYSTGASRADWDRVLATFVPDGVWDVPDLGARFEGLEEIRGGLLRFSGPMDYIVQLNTPAVIEVDGDTAAAHSVIRECGKFSGRDEALEVLGLYADKLVRTAGGWKFALRVFEIRGMHSFPLSPPAAPQ